MAILSIFCIEHLNPAHKKDLKQLPTKMAEGGYAEARKRQEEIYKRAQPQQPASQPQSDFNDKQKAFSAAVKQSTGYYGGGKVEHHAEDPVVGDQQGSTPIPTEPMALHTTGEIPKQDEPSVADQMALHTPGEPAETTPAPVPANLKEQTVLGVSKDEAEGAPDIFGKEQQAREDVINLAEQQGLTKQLAEVQSAKAKAGEKLALRDAQVNEHLANTTQRIAQAERDELTAAEKDMNNGYFHPRHLFDARNGTWNNVLTGVGLILGGRGLGGKLIDIVQKQIDADNLGDTRLVENIKHKYANDKEALSMANIYKTAAFASELAKATAKATTQEAKINGQLAMTQLQTNLNQKIQEHAHAIAANRMLSGQSPSGQPTGQNNPGLLIEQVVPESERPKALEQLKEAQQSTKAAQSLLSGFDEVSKMWGAGLLAPNQRDAIIEPLIAQLSKESAGRFTEADAKALRHLMPSATDATETTREVKRKRLEQFLKQRMNFPLLETYRIPTPSLGDAKQIDFKPKK